MPPIPDRFKNVTVARQSVNTQPAYSYDAFGNPTAQAKIISVNNQAGNPGIAFQQGATVIIYDSLPLDGRLTYNFFDQVNTRTFPDTNLTENRLGVGESMTIQEIWFSVVTKAAGVVTLNAPLAIAAATAPLYLSNFSFVVGGSQIIKNLPLTAMQSFFNSDSNFLNRDVMKLKTNSVIPSMFEFILPLKAASAVVVANNFLMVTIKGTGSLLSPKQNL